MVPARPGGSGAEHDDAGGLAEHIAAIENDKPEDALSSAERKRVYICLYQCHLPTMDDAGVVDFDDRRKTVELGENAGTVTGYLPETAGNGSPRERGGWTSALANAASAVDGWLRSAR